MQLFQIFLIYWLVSKAHCNGMVELVISSPKTVIASRTICTNFRCTSMDETARASKVDAGMPLRQKVAAFSGESPSEYDIHVVISNLENEQIGYYGSVADSSTLFRTGTIETRDGFNVTFQYRILCANNYYGIRCGRFCEDSVEAHLECTTSGEKRCMHGWTGPNCMTPTCSNSCSFNGKCVAPEKCRCNAGYSGESCDVCVPKRGCAHGGCANNVSFTCECHPGYGGALCTFDLNTCNRLRPCQNEGICQGSNSPRGFTCQCRDGFAGERCEIPVKVVGYEQQNNDNKCTSSYCRNGGTCSFSMTQQKPICQCSTCYKGEKCEILDAICLVQQMNATIVHARVIRSGGGRITADEESYGLILIIVLLLVAILFLSIGIFWILTRLRKDQIPNLDETVTTIAPKKWKEALTTSSPVFKVSVINPQLNHPNSPPPDYYPPLPAYSPQIGMVKSVTEVLQALPSNDESPSEVLSKCTLDGTNV